MDIGKHNYSFYEGYEGEPEFILSAGNDSIHIWDGYINDIFGNPELNGKKWKGITRDYNEMTGPFDETKGLCQIDVKDYLEDAIVRQGHETNYEESTIVLDALINWLRVHSDEKVFADIV